MSDKKVVQMFDKDTEETMTRYVPLARLIDKEILYIDGLDLETVDFLIKLPEDNFYPVLELINVVRSLYYHHKVINPSDQPFNKPLLLKILSGYFTPLDSPDFLDIVALIYECKGYFNSVSMTTLLSVMIAIPKDSIDMILQDIGQYNLSNNVIIAPDWMPYGSENPIFADTGMSLMHASAEPLEELPEGLTELICDKLTTLPKLPSSLKFLSCNAVTELPELPGGLLELLCNSVEEIDKLPPNLENLSCNNAMSLPEFLPTTLVSISCSKDLIITNVSEDLLINNP